MTSARTSVAAESSVRPTIALLSAFIVPSPFRDRNRPRAKLYSSFRHSGQSQAFCEMAAIAGVLERHPGDQLVDGGGRLNRQAARYHFPRAFRTPEIRAAPRQHR